MILVVDNWDSFTFNLVQSLLGTGEPVLVRRNDELAVDDVHRLAPTLIVISPGPNAPRDAGASIPIVERFLGERPILGVCLGHQCIAEVLGATIRRAPEPRHGRQSRIRPAAVPLYDGCPDPMDVGRYHSLCAVADDLPRALRVTAVAEDDGVIMSFELPGKPVWGVQFHPESVLTPDGDRLLANAVRLARAWTTTERPR